MVNKKSSFIIAAIVSIFSLITVAYTSCSKPGKSANTCEGVVCQNNGFCHVDSLTGNPFCSCPTGYEGPNCGTVSVKKFIGQWDITQTVIGSDSLNFKGVVYKYTAFLEQTATPTTFFINNLSDNKYYNNIICTIDSSNSQHFYLDTISAYHMLYDHYSLLYGGGTIYNDDSIAAVFATRHLSPTSNWINDTFSFTLVLRH